MVLLCPYADERKQDVERTKQEGNAGEIARLALALRSDLVSQEISQLEYQALIALLNGNPSR